MSARIRERTGRLCRTLGIELPILAAPMDGVSTPELAAAVSEAGGLGMLAGDFLSPEQLEGQILATRALTGRPFGVSLRLSPRSRARPDEGMERLAEALEPLRDELGCPPDERFGSVPDFERMLEVVLSLRVPVLGVTFGGLREAYAERVRDRGIRVIGTATSTREAKALAASGADVLVAQGAEAGGPRLNFEQEDRLSLTGLMSLVGSVCRVSRLPVAASGGISGGAQAAACLMLGAGAVQVGSLLMRSAESGLSAGAKSLLGDLGDSPTVLSDAYAGRLERLFPNGLMQALAEAGLEKALPWPRQWSAMRPVVLAARRQDRTDLMPLYAGQGAAAAREEPAGRIIVRLAGECRQILREMEAEL